MPVKNCAYAILNLPVALPPPGLVTVTEAPLGMYTTPVLVSNTKRSADLGRITRGIPASITEALLINTCLLLANLLGTADLEGRNSDPTLNANPSVDKIFNLNSLEFLLPVLFHSYT